MAYIDYIAEEMIPPDSRVPDQDTTYSGSTVSTAGQCGSTMTYINS